MGEGASEGLFILLSFPLLPGVVLLVIGAVLRRRRPNGARALLVVGAVLAGVGVLPLLVIVVLDLIVLVAAGGLS